METPSLIIPAFIAGVITFFAPCTFPLVPGFLGFISGGGGSRRKVFLNGLIYTLGFSAVFILLGSLFGLGGAALIKYRLLLSRIGGVFVIIFGLYLMRIFTFDFLNRAHRLNLMGKLKPGTPFSSFLFGATFAFGWTPCIGPLLGSILLLASTSATVGKGALLLVVFSVGLATPFLLIALAWGHAAEYVKKINRYVHIVSMIGGAFLVLLGILLLTNKFGVLIGLFFRWFRFLKLEERLLNYL